MKQHIGKKVSSKKEIEKILLAHHFEEVTFSLSGECGVMRIEQGKHIVYLGMEVFKDESGGIVFTYKNTKRIDPYPDFSRDVI